MEPREKTMLHLVIISITGIVLAAVVIILGIYLISTQSHPLTAPTATQSTSTDTVTSSTFNTSTPSSPSTCPTSNQVAQAMGVPPAAVVVLNDEPCAFKLDAGFIETASITQAHCSSGFGLS